MRSYKNGVLGKYKIETERGYQKPNGSTGWTYGFNTIVADVSIIFKIKRFI